MHDRVEQALDLLGLDPVSESTADHHSYGFRKVRSAQDAMGAIYNALRRKDCADWILEADIKGWFDHIEGFPTLPSAAFLLNRNPDTDNYVVDSLAEHIKKAVATRMNL